MRTRNVMIVVVILGLVLAGLGGRPARAQNAGSANIFRGNAARTGEMAGPGPVGDPVEQRRFVTGMSVESSPVVAGGMLYAGSYDGIFYAFDVATGAEVWRLDTGVYSQAAAAVVDGVVYFGSGDTNVYALDAATGAETWRFTIQNSAFEMTPAVVGGAVYIGSNDKNLYALNAATGVELWRFATGSWVVSSPAVVDGVVYAGSGDANIYAIAGSG